MQSGNQHFTRVFGNTAILNRLERLGRNTRIFPNMVEAGFPSEQLRRASHWFAEEAGTPVERYASDQMVRGFYEDESLLHLFCRYYECTDWKLENSLWFFSREDYARFYAALLSSIEFQIAQLEQGLGEDRWSAYFLKLPFDLAMDQARAALWEDVLHQEYYWKPMETYAHLRSEMLFRYLQRTVNIIGFTADQYHYNWERTFREKLQATLRRFSEALEHALRHWQEERRERTSHRFHYRTYTSAHAYEGVILQAELLDAFSVLGLDQRTATLSTVRKAFRRLSKRTHPDHGGSPEAFRKLSESKLLAETWLKRDARGTA